MADGVLSMGRVVWAIGNWEVARAAETRSRGDVWVWNCVVWLRKRQRTGAVQDLSVRLGRLASGTRHGVRQSSAAFGTREQRGHERGSIPGRNSRILYISKESACDSLQMSR